MATVISQAARLSTLSVPYSKQQEQHELHVRVLLLRKVSELVLAPVTAGRKVTARDAVGQLVDCVASTAHVQEAGHVHFDLVPSGVVGEGTEGGGVWNQK